MFTMRWCDVCGAESEFATFECAEHGGDCLELGCTGCGAAVELAPLAAPAPGEVTTAA